MKIVAVPSLKKSRENTGAWELTNPHSLKDAAPAQVAAMLRIKMKNDFIFV
tara:strand:+ start:470 stop:622 length:153 start_codon:yes stop_codon:yes gene_type:complete